MLIHDVILLMTCSMSSLNTGIRKQAQLPLDKAVPGVWKYEKQVSFSRKDLHILKGKQQMKFCLDSLTKTSVTGSSTFKSVLFGKF